MWFGDNTSKNYTLHIALAISLSGNLKIMYRGLSKSNAPYFLSPYILVVWEKPLHQWSPWAFSIVWVSCNWMLDGWQHHSWFWNGRVSRAVQTVTSERVFGAWTSVADLDLQTFVQSVWWSYCGCEYCLTMGKADWKTFNRRSITLWQTMEWSHLLCSGVSQHLLGWWTNMQWLAHNNIRIMLHPIFQ